MMNTPTDPKQTIPTLRALFDAALEQPNAARAAWLDAHVSDPSLRARLNRLLHAHDMPGALDRPAAQHAAQMNLAAEQPAAELLGQLFAGFRLVRLLGQGGMATVFLGEREGVDFEQRAAIKLLRRGLYSELEQHLFQRERRVLASLNHPNIARLIDGGVMPSGIPFLVIEYVDGQPITAYAHARALDLRARIELLISVCAAVAAAHRALIVHRDLKPGNILVDAHGQVKLLDFGIAKLLDDDATGEHHARTAQSILTPDYAAPEQLLGGEITTATDVYALGVIAHELLLGARPARSPTGGLIERTSDSAAHARRRGDLDNVLRKALAEDATVRYPDAAALGDDLLNYLEARPVQAHPPSGWYRARKFIRRHRGGVAITALLTLGMLVSLGVALWQAHAARQQAQRAQEVQDFIESLFAPVEQGQALTQAPTVIELIERGVARLEQAYPANSNVRADLLALFARIGLAQGQYARTRELAAAAEQANIATYGIGDARATDAAFVRGEVLRRLGEFDAALAVFEGTLARLRAAEVHGMDLARLLDAISALRMERGMHVTEAVALKQQALAERERDPNVTQEDLAVGYNNLGAAYQYGGAFDDALVWFGKALDINLRLRPDSRSAATSLLNMGLTLGYAGRWREALEKLEQSRATFARLPITQHPALAQTLTQLCRIHTELEQFDAARQRCDEAVAMSEAVQGPDHANTIWALSRRVETAYAAGRIADGDADLARAQAANARSSGDRNYNDTILDGVRARHLRAQRKAVELRDVALYLLSDASGLSRRGKSPSEMHLEAYVAWGCALAPDPRCAGHGPARVHALFDDPRFVRSAQRLSAMNMLAEIALHEGRPSDAIAELRDAPERFAELLGAGHSQIALALWLRADAHERLGDTEAARAERTRARSLLDALPATHPLRLSLESAH